MYQNTTFYYNDFFVQRGLYTFKSTSVAFWGLLQTFCRKQIGPFSLPPSSLTAKEYVYMPRLIKFFAETLPEYKSRSICLLGFIS